MNALEISKYIIAYSEQIGKPVNNIRLQTLLYYLQHIFYEDVEFTKDGIPYVKEIYFKYIYSAGKPILGENIGGEIPNEIKEVVDKWTNTKTWKLIDRIIDERS